MIIMKKYYSLILLLHFFSLQAQTISFSDLNFKNKLLLSSSSTSVAKDSNGNNIAIDTNNNNEVELSEALNVYQLDVSAANISQLNGIENFTNLEFLQVQDNSLTTLPVSDLSALKLIYCSNNQITNLSQIENLVHLEDLWISNNPISSLNLSNLSALWRLVCENSLLQEINTCGTSVSVLWIDNNPNIQTINIKNNVISPDYYNWKLTPPPIKSFSFINLPNLTNIYHDNGEYAAVFTGLNDVIPTGVSISTASNNCLLSSETFSSDNNIIIYPNPATSVLHIDTKHKKEIQSITIYNSIGQVVYKDNSQKSEIYVTQFESGYYTIKIETDSETEFKKFLKK